jgi:uncharacterized membrane protein YfcA
MNAIHSLQPFYTVAGFAVGMLVGLTGVGGGSLMTPILIVLFGVHPATAVGTDLLYAAATKTAGSLVHGYNRTVDWRVVRRLASGSVPLTVLTIWALSYININGAAARELIAGVLTLALFATALMLVFRDRIVGRYAARIVGSDIAHAVPLTLAAGIGHWWLGSINLDLLVPLLLGSVPGILIGSYTVAHVPEKALRLLLAATLVLVATKLSFDVHSSGMPVVTATTNRAH